MNFSNEGKFFHLGVNSTLGKGGISYRGRCAWFFLNDFSIPGFFFGEKEKSVFLGAGICLKGGGGVFFIFLKKKKKGGGQSIYFFLKKKKIF